MAKKTNETKWLERAVLLIWAVLVLAGMLTAAGIWWLGLPVDALASAPDQTATITPTITATFFMADTPTPIVIPPAEVIETAQVVLESAVTPEPISEILEEPTTIPSPTMTPTIIPWSSGPVVIGQSVEGRNIEVYRFGIGPTAVMIVGGIHGAYEGITVELAYELIEYVYANPGIIPPDRTLYILPILNVDGYAVENKYQGRPNANGVDLNRNWLIDWEKDYDKSGCWNNGPITSGEFAGSEPETQALMLFAFETPLQALISYHAAAPGFYAADDPFEQRSDWLSDYLAEASGYPNPAINTGCFMTGSMVDFFANLGTAAADLELTNHYNTEFDKNLKLLIALLKWDGAE